MKVDTQKVIDDFSRTTDEIISLDGFKELLSSGRKLRIKYGVDVTAPFLHIGHAVNLWMMRRLQDMGHKVIFLIGDVTTLIGDPTGQNKARPIISEEAIEANIENFIKQAGMVLRFDDPELFEIRRNSEWFSSMDIKDLIQLLSMVTLDRVRSRDMFRKRDDNGENIYMHELIYPVLQGYDSVALQSDLTIIGSDQLFNEMLGRFFQEKSGQSPQVIITTKITPGIDGKEKQSKSLGNYIGLGHSPRDKFGRVMKLPDNLIIDYLSVYTEVSETDIERIQLKMSGDPMSCKMFLAERIVERYHGMDVAEQEKEWFVKSFSERKVPDNIPELTVPSGSLSGLEIVKLFFGNQKSNREIRRLFEQGAVSLNSVRLSDPLETLSPENGDVFKVGKRVWFKIRE